MFRGTKMASGALIAAAVILTGLSGPARAGQETALSQSVSRLGELNGIALACKQGALAVRLREVMIEMAPKQRDVGEDFENATNASFLAFGQAGQQCPDGRTLAGQIDSATAALKHAIGALP